MSEFMQYNNAHACHCEFVHFATLSVLEQAHASKRKMFKIMNTFFSTHRTQNEQQAFAQYQSFLINITKDMMSPLQNHQTFHAC